MAIFTSFNLLFIFLERFYICGLNSQLYTASVTTDHTLTTWKS